MSGPESTASFEETAARLRQQREATEAEFRERLSELDARVRRLADQAEAAATQAESHQQASEPLIESDWVAATARQPVAEVASVNWPPAGGRLGLARLARWILRDHLEVLDRRYEILAAELVAARADDASRAQAVEERMTALAARDEEVVAHLRGQAAQQRDASEAVRGALNYAVEALGGLVGVVEAVTLLVDAKDAEGLQRAAHGPLRKMELMFDEFARQQEALLAGLVGRRRELDALLEKVERAALSAASDGGDG